jgi:hypothetical protein
MSIATPEFVNEEKGEFVLLSNHFIAGKESLEMSIAYNKARLAFMKLNLPSHLAKSVLFYDIRGQAISNFSLDKIRETFPDSEVRILS